MKVLLVHLSDIHITNNDDIVFDNIDKIKQAILSGCHNIKKCFLIITGDIVFSGKQDQYLLAIDILVKLKEMIEEQSIEVEIEIVPGNHDCDFDSKNNNGTRNATIKQVVNNEENLDQSMICTNTSIQNNFFQFYNTVKEENVDNKIFYKNTYNVEDKKIIFNCFNTSWMSTKKEEYGGLVFPIDFIKEEIETNGDLIISMFHHPYNWLAYDSRKRFKKYIEKISDLILTGHEHYGNMQSVRNKFGNLSEYFEGGVLQEDKNLLNSSFNMIIVDLDQMQYKYMEFQFDDTMYRSILERDWENIQSSSCKNSLTKLNVKFEAFLNDAGANFVNDKKSNIYLDDIYIYPDLRKHYIKKNLHEENENEILITGNKLLQYAIDEKNIFITGENLIGKTALAKNLFKEFLKTDYVPLLINGKDIANVNPENLEKLIYKTYENEFSKDLLEVYKQTKKQKKILILDDLNKSKLNLKGKNVFVEFLKEYFDTIILFGTDDIYMQIFSDHKEYNRNLLNFSYYQIMEFGHLLRDKLITKWYSIGNEYSIDEGELEKKSIKAERIVNVMLGKNLIPSYPMYILMILPLCDDIKTTIADDKRGSYGYLYEALITENLSKIKSKININTKYTYLSVIAYYKFKNDMEVFDSDTLKKAHEIYQKTHDKIIDFNTVIDELIQSNILEKHSGSYNFKYKYLYYYFVAKYISDNIEEEEIKKLIKEMSEKLYSERNSNIILFLCHLSKNKFIIDNILSNSRQIFKKVEPCDLNNNVDFLNNMYSKVANVELELTDPQINREKMLNDKDKMELSNNRAYKEISADEDKEQFLQEDNQMLSLNKALKTIQILGLIVKNFEGSLKSNEKYDITKESYLLGMRTLNLFIEMFNDNLEEWIKDLSKLFDTILKEKRDVEKFIYLVCEILSFAMIKKISSTIGIEELNETYKRIIKDNNIVSFKLIDASIKIDNYKNFPQNTIIELHKELKNNFFANLLLNKLVAKYFYLYSCDYTIRQKICDNLGIRLNMTKVLTKGNKL